MKSYLAIVAYRCLVAGVSKQKLDIQVMWFNAGDKDAVRDEIRASPLQSYLNSDGDTVTWELVEIFAVDEFAPNASGEEVIGFIASIDELADLV